MTIHITKPIQIKCKSNIIEKITNELVESITFLNGSIDFTNIFQSKSLVSIKFHINPLIDLFIHLINIFIWVMHVLGKISLMVKHMEEYYLQIKKCL